MEYWVTFWFYVALKIAKVFWISLYLLLTFKELVSSLLDSSIKLLRFLINWKNSLWWKRFVHVVIVSLAFPCLLQKGKIFEVQEMQNHGSAVLLYFIVTFIKIIAFDMNPVVTVITENCHIRSFNCFLANFAYVSHCW